MKNLPASKNCKIPIWDKFKICLLRAESLLKKSKKQFASSILMINTNNLGDLLCDTPSFKNIRDNFPSHHIVLLVRSDSGKELLTQCPYIDEIIVMPHWHDNMSVYKKIVSTLRKYAFEFSIQFTRPFCDYRRTYLPYMLGIRRRYGLIQQEYKKIYARAFTHKYYLNNSTSRIEESLNLVKLLGLNVYNYEIECWIDENKVTEQNYSNYIIIQTCATLQCRMWHKKFFVELIKKITKKYNLKILLTGTKNEYNYINEIKTSINNDNVKVVSDINIHTLLSLIKNSICVITTDSGPLHFSRALNKPTIAIFGTSPPEYFLGQTSNNINVLRKKCNKCSVYSVDCKKEYRVKEHCVNAITPDDVFKVFEDIIKNCKDDK